MASEDVDEDDDAHSEASSSGLPPPLITASSYDAFVCSTCVLKIDTLRRYAGTPGVLMVVRDTPEDPWKIIGRATDQSETVDIGASTESSETPIVGEKRPRSDAGEEGQQSKRPRADAPQTNGPENGASDTTSAPPCLAPQPNPQAQSLLSAIQTNSYKPVLLGTGDIFLAHGWRNRWCQCNAVSSIVTSAIVNPLTRHRSVSTVSIKSLVFTGGRRDLRTSRRS